MTAFWRRLRRIEVEHTCADELLSIADALRRAPGAREMVEGSAAKWLERLARNQKALTLLTSAGPGRKRDSVAPHLALDYLVQKELLGKAAAAEACVAKAWGVRGGTVRDAWTESQAYARWKLAELIGDSDRPDRRQRLEDVSVDLREMHATRSRRK